MAKISPADLKVGVIGYGGAFNMGRVHLNEMKKAGMTPVAVSELDSARREVATQDFPGIQTYATVAEMLKKSNVNLITIITPHNTHAPLALQCLKAGKHVVCEKPLAITTAECDQMIAAARQKKVVLSTYHNRHWDGSITNALKHVQAGDIGDVVRIQARAGAWGHPGDWWRSSRSISGGILYDWGVHLLEYGLQILKSDIKEVSGFAKHGFWASQLKWGKDANEDEAFALVRFKNGSWMTLTVSQIDAHTKPGMIEITGTKGTYWFDYNNWEMIQPDQQGGSKVIRGKNPEAEWWRFYQNLADHLTKGKKLVITPEWSRRPIHILDLASQSAAQGKALKAKYA
jgi:predicted dehydrogenase